MRESVEAFLARGGTITKLADSETALDEQGMSINLRKAVNEKTKRAGKTAASRAKSTKRK